jgi:hypothetical protein
LFLEPFARGWGTGVRLMVKGWGWEIFPTTETALIALSESMRVRNQLRRSWNIKCFTDNTLVSYQVTSWICYATLIKGVRALAYWLPSPQWRHLVESLSQFLRLFGRQIGCPRLVTTCIARRDGIEVGPRTDRSQQTPCRYLRMPLKWLFSLLRECYSPT